MTEVLLCYDSRGKNAMFASWGPQKAGGDYIWYPIFYDIDTQLGINNTGIPSFEYYENATEDFTFSTADSVLWNNLYREFFEDIKGTYKILRESMNSTRYSGNGPLQTIDHIENWYLAKPYNDEIIEAQKETAKLQHIEMCGDRPLAMFNMDEWFKYLTITNSAAEGYQDRTGNLKVDTSGTYFYALQGDRSLSRRQFLDRRINFIDSWFSLYNYSKTDGTSIVGRITANRKSETSDQWVTDHSNAEVIQSDISAYYETNDDGSNKLDANNRPIKINYLDADNYVKLTPYQNSYVTFYIDDTSSGSVIYEGKPVYYNYPGEFYNKVFNVLINENLVYIPGADAIEDIGDVSKMYWAEFEAVNARHLSRILLGNDHPKFFNNIVKKIGLDGGFSEDPETHERVAGKPLLKEVNFSGIQFTNKVTFPIDLSSAEKLKVFKALRSNMLSVTFSDGVALNTLYLPSTVNNLRLIEANDLKKVLGKDDVLTTEESFANGTYYSTYDPVNDVWTAKEGLYIEGLTNLDITPETPVPEDLTSKLSTIEMVGGSLGYGSYDIIYKLYRIFKKDNNSGQDVLKISMKDVAWTPYIMVDSDAIYNSNVTYYKDDGHYGFEIYNYVNVTQWNLDIANGLVYYYDQSLEDDSKKIKDVQMLLDFIQRGQFRNIQSAGESTPVLTGDIYINNDVEVDELIIRNTLLGANGFNELGDDRLNLHFKKVKKQYKATFCQINEDGTTKIIGTQVVGLNGRFSNPYTTYRDSAKRDNYDFFGWGTANSQDSVITSTDWATSEATIASDENKHDYTFYAVFERHTFKIQFLKGSVNIGFENATDPIGVKFGDFIPTPKVDPGLDESGLADDRRYKFLGWTQDRSNTIVSTPSKAKIVDVSSIQASDDLIFYAVFCEESVYDSVTDLKYFTFTPTSYTNVFTGDRIGGANNAYAIGLKLYNEETQPDGYAPTALTGKITLPSYYEGYPVIAIAPSGFANNTNITHVFFEKNNAAGPPQLRKINEYAFNSCTSLKKISWPETTEYLGQYCFAHCQNLEITEVGGNINYIESYAFHNDLANVTDDLYLGGNIRYLASRAFNTVNMNVNTLIIGSKTEPSQLRNSGGREYDYVSNGGFFRHNVENGVSGVTIYCSAVDQSFFQRLIDEGYITMRPGATVNIFTV